MTSNNTFPWLRDRIERFRERAIFPRGAIIRDGVAEVGHAILDSIESVDVNVRSTPKGRDIDFRVNLKPPHKPNQ